MACMKTIETPATSKNDKTLHLGPFYQKFLTLDPGPKTWNLAAVTPDPWPPLDLT